MLQRKAEELGEYPHAALQPASVAKKQGNVYKDGACRFPGGRGEVMLSTYLSWKSPKGVFKGRNFMTPEVLGYTRGTWQGRTVWIEVSKGRGLIGDTIYGVTVRRANGAECDGGEDPSRMCRSEKEVLACLEMLHAGGRYGDDVREDDFVRPHDAVPCSEGAGSV